MIKMGSGVEWAAGGNPILEVLGRFLIDLQPFLNCFVLFLIVFGVLGLIGYLAWAKTV